MPSFFEGPEKKVELVVISGGLRGLGPPFWHEIVSRARAAVLSVISTDSCDAYLLSESSLFVYDDHITMITCGQTTLIEAVLAVIEHVGPGDIAALFYERKNEHFPEMQSSSFYDDARRLAEVIPGRALRFGEDYANRIFVFHSQRDYQPDPSDTTLEILMHGLDPERADLFHERGNGSSENRCRTIARELNLDGLIPSLEFAVDDHAFSPAGYSLNALAGGIYYTIHVTPEEVGSYVSFETNFDFRSAPAELVARVVEAFRPESYDILCFRPLEPEPAALELAGGEGYRLRKHVHEELCGYDVTFLSFFRPHRGPERAFPIEL